MKPLSLNMSKVKKIACDKNSSTFKHEDGHEIKIAHSALSPLQRKQIEKLPIYAEGGKVTPSPTPNPSGNTAFDEINMMRHGKDVTSDYEQGQYKAMKQLHKENGLPMYADGGTTEDDSVLTRLGKSITSALEPKASPTPDPEADRNAKYAKIRQTNTENMSTGNYAKGGQVQHYDQGTEEVVQPDSQPAQQIPSSVFAQQPVQTQSQTIPQNPSMLSGNGLLNAPAAFNLQQKSAREQQAVDSAKGTSQANTEDAYIKQRAAIAQRDQDIANNLNNHTVEVTKAIQEGAINPNHYFENRLQEGKTNTAMGIALGSIGSAVTGQSNQALDFLNRQIDRDIDAQKARSDQQRTIYGMYKDAYQSDVIAQDLAKKSMNDIYAHKLLQTAAQLATPQAKAIADNFAAQKAMENNQLLLQASQNAGIETANPQRGVGQSTSQEQQSNLSTKEQEALNIFKKNTQQESEKEPNFEDEKSTGVFPILAPKAEGFLKYGAKLHPFAKEDNGELNRQYQQARQAEKIINGPKSDGKGGIHDLFQQMYSNSGRGGISGAGGALQRAGSRGVGAIAGGLTHLLGGSTAGDAAAAVGGSGVGIPPMTASQRSYDTLQARLKTDIASGLKGLISVHDIDSLVNKFTPSFNDKPVDVKRKEEALIAAIKNAIPSDKLEQYNLLAKPKK